MENNNYDSNLYILNTETNNSYKLTNSNKDKSFKWLNNEEIIFSNSEGVFILSYE